MSRLEESERQELTAMRDNIVKRMEELQQQVDHGTITDDKRYEQLEEEFGFDYHETLANINSLLYAQEHSSWMAPRTLIAALLGLFLLGVAISATITMSPTAYTILGSEQQLEPNQLLQAKQTQSLELPEKAVITSIKMTNPSTLTIEDAYRKFTLYHEGRCVGCGQILTEPYLITNEGEKHTTIKQIGVIQQ